MAIMVLKSGSNPHSLKNLSNKLSSFDLTNLKEKNIVLVKDNFSLTVEKDILQTLGLYGTFNVDVLSFSRMLSKFQKGKTEKKYLSSFGGVMIICRVVLENKDKLLCYKNSSSYMGFYKRLYELIERLKGDGVTPASLQAERQYPTLLCSKLHDIALIYSEYEKAIKEQYFDESTKLDILCEVIETNPQISNCNLFLTNFDSYTKKDYKVLSYLVRYCKNVVFSTVTNTSLSIYHNDAYNQIIRLLNDLEVDYTEEEYFDNGHSDACGIRDFLYCHKSGCERGENVTLFCANDVLEELYHVGLEITQRIKNGARYKDIAIVCQDHDGYRQSVENVFSRLGIPYYLPHNMSLESHPMLRLILDVIDEGDKAKKAISIVKNPLSTVDYDSACVYENYLLKYSYKDELIYEDKDFETVVKTHERVKELIRAYPFLPLASCKRLCGGIREFFKVLEMDKKLEVLAALQLPLSKVAADFTLQVGQSLMDVLSQLEFVYGDFILTKEEFFSVLLSGVCAVKVSVIPKSNDCVLIGSVNDLKFTTVQHLFFIGVCEGSIPTVKKDWDLLSGNDISLLNGSGFDLIDCESENAKERFFTYLALQNFTSSLCLSYSRHAADGKNVSPSYLLSEFKSALRGHRFYDATLFDAGYLDYSSFIGELKNEAVTKENLTTRFLSAMGDYPLENQDYQVYFSTVYSLLKNSGIQLDEYVSHKKPNRIKLGAELFFINPTISSGMVEGYYSCPYRNFLEKGLRLKEREEFGLNQLDIGVLLHDIVERFSSLANAFAGEFPDVVNSVEGIFLEVLQKREYRKLQSDKASILLLGRIRDEAYKVCYHIVKQMRLGKLSIAKTEWDFTSQGMPVLGDISLSGKIDRLDTYDKYARIIDYKTGKADISLKEVFLGCKSQLNLYLKQVESMGYEGIGNFYFEIHNNYTDSEEKDYRLKGRMVSDADIVALHDGSIKDGKSEIVNLYRDYQMPKEGFSLLTEYSYILAQNAVKSLQSGCVSVNPVAGACEYCGYKNVCEYDSQTTKCRKLSAKVTAEKITEAARTWLGQKNNNKQ